MRVDIYEFEVVQAVSSLRSKTLKDISALMNKDVHCARTISLLSCSKRGRI